MEDTAELIIKLTLSTGEIKRHTYSDCPNTKEAFHQWWQTVMLDIISPGSGLRIWIQLDNPFIFYNINQIVSWEFEYSGDERLRNLVREEAAIMLHLV